jgi:hypothetical protein
MLGVYASAAAILLASLLLGRAGLTLLGLRKRTWLAGAVGFAGLIIVAPILIRLPGRGTSASIVLGVAVIGSALYLWRQRPAKDADSERSRSRTELLVATAVTLLVVAAASIPFAVNERNGVLGEGIYTNDQAAQLYWTNWLQHDTGPEPGAVRFGYPTGPQSVAATAADATHADLISAFNGLLIAVAALTALTALAALDTLPPGRRIVASALTGLPYLAASFLAQSAFKETTMALLVLALAVTLQRLALSMRGVTRGHGPHPRRALAAAGLVIAAASVFTYSVPGLVWFALAVPIWLFLERAWGALRLDGDRAASAIRRHGHVIAAVGILLVGGAVFFAAELSGFIDKLGMVQASTGRLNAPIYPGEALGVWPEGNFQLARGEVDGAYIAIALGLLAALIGVAGAISRRDWGLLAVGASTIIVYVGARLFASYYVDAKALAVMAPLVVMAALKALFAPSWRRRTADDPAPRAPERSRRLVLLRYAAGTLVAAALAASTLLALRATPVGFDQRGSQLEHLASLIRGRSVVFFGVDRFAPYWLRGTLAESPGGNAPTKVPAREKKSWAPGLAMDFDTISSSRLDGFEYAITTDAPYQSTPPPNFRPVAQTRSFVLWRRIGPTPHLSIIDKAGTPGRVLSCAGQGGIAGRGGVATVLHAPVVGGPWRWSRSSPFDAPATVSQQLQLGPGRWNLSLQYASQVPLTVHAGGESTRLPPSLDGMYIDHKGQGSFWSAGKVDSRGGMTTITVDAAQPSGLQRLLGVKRQVWLGYVAATQPGSRRVSLRAACGHYVDHWRQHS